MFRWYCAEMDAVRINRRLWSGCVKWFRCLRVGKGGLKKTEKRKWYAKQNWLDSIVQSIDEVYEYFVITTLAVITNIITGGPFFHSFDKCSIRFDIAGILKGSGGGIISVSSALESVLLTVCFIVETFNWADAKINT